MPAETRLRKVGDRRLLATDSQRKDEVDYSPEDVLKDGQTKHGSLLRDASPGDVHHDCGPGSNPRGRCRYPPSPVEVPLSAKPHRGVRARGQQHCLPREGKWQTQLTHTAVGAARPVRSSVAAVIERRRSRCLRDAASTVRTWELATSRLSLST